MSGAWERQGLHALLLGGLLLLVFGLAFLLPGALQGQLWGLPTLAWLTLAVADPVAHQILVAFFWRAELYGGRISARFGREGGFRLYKILFTLFFAGRLVTIILVGMANYRSLDLTPLIAYPLSLLLFLPAAYLFYSVDHYFGMDRAYGIDHFDPSLPRPAAGQAGHLPLYR